jgi:Tfp pilus assembly protein PilF
MAKAYLSHCVSQTFLWILLTLLFLSGCVTINQDGDEDKKTAEILSAQKGLIVSLLNRGMAPLALKELRKVIKEHPNDVDFKNLMGLTQLSLGNPKQAVGYFQSAYQLEKRLAVGLNLSSALIEVGKHQEAIKHLLVIKSSPEAESYPYPERIDHNIGLAYEKRNKLETAQRYYAEALSFNPNFYISLIRSAQVYDKLKQKDKAKEMYQRAQQVCPVCYDPVGGLVAAYLHERQVDKALSTLQAYLNNPQVSPADQVRAKKALKTSGLIKKSTTTLH